MLLKCLLHLGESSIKVVYRSKQDCNDGKNIIKLQGYGILRLKNFSVKDLDTVAEFLVQNSDVTLTTCGPETEMETEPVGCITGLTAQRLKFKLEKFFGIRLQIYPEIMAIEKIAKLMAELDIGYYDLEYGAFEVAATRVKVMLDVFARLPTLGETTLKDYEFVEEHDRPGVFKDGADLTDNYRFVKKFDGPIFELVKSTDIKEWAAKYLQPSSGHLVTPCILMVFGSAAVAYLVTDDYEVKLVDVCSAAGKSFHGLVEEVTGEKSMDEIMKMAARGNLNNVTTLNSDLRNYEHTEHDWYTLFPDEYPVFELGKLTSANAKGKGIYSKEDLAAGILNVVTMMISKCAYNQCKIRELHRVYFAGHFISYELVRKMITSNFLGQAFWLGLEKGYFIKPLFVRQSGFLKALGLWFANVGLNNKNKKNKKT
ncbi:hypothetical protein HELRODRAFT_193937 [Helobdella robusta]|uniref:Uncharacterized protein n=1 Tax=Helobdella robusta TaxID=6412 RepID=T1FVH7_HELRO|nr:hypothetical protein HELRODRAFT_193937 [Helobdella robusta]ESN93732.1 hypothetical protein HELRODRAFT_193937 [Helobdella robusta]